MPIAYWLKPSTAELFINGSLLSKYADLRQGLITGDNDRFLRFWSECDARKISTLNDRNKVSKNILLNHHVQVVEVEDKKILRVENIVNGTGI